MAKLPDPIPSLTPEAREVYDELLSSRGALRGPYRSLMHHPALARRVGSLGSFLRFGEGVLPGGRAGVGGPCRGPEDGLPLRMGHARPRRR